ncbi:hypothetical protein PG993_014634 [Apiospora rasikravindrae]|uniref:Uncharacterized protein n=1 Tax=Apiospora rasikravindrae TaxID=990691 RepID=A0ABR1RPP8_9PEZI
MTIVVAQSESGTPADGYGYLQGTSVRRGSPSIGLLWHMPTFGFDSLWSVLHAVLIDHFAARPLSGSTAVVVCSTVNGYL